MISKATAHVLIIPDANDCHFEEIEVTEGIPKLEEQVVVVETPQINLHAMLGIVMP